jgi:hypothetical protein
MSDDDTVVTTRISLTSSRTSEPFSMLLTTTGGSDVETQDRRSSGPPLDRAVAQGRHFGERPMGTGGGWDAARIRHGSLNAKR